MPNEADPNGLATPKDVAEAVEALDQVIHEITDAKRSEWRPRRQAVTARRLVRFEDEIRRHALKPPAA